MLDSKLDAGAISARIDRLPVTRTMRIYLILLGLGMFFELYELLYTGYVAPSIIASGVLSKDTPGLFGTTGVAGFIAALFSGLFVGTMVCGFLADAFGRRIIFIASLLWYAAANVLVACQHTAFWLDFWRFVSGLGLGLEIVTIGAYVSELAPKSIRGRAFALNQAIGFCAVPVVSLLAYLLTPNAPFGIEGWRWVILAGAASALCVGILRRGLPESPRWLAQVGRLEEADRVLKDIEAKVEAEYGRALPPPGAPEPIDQAGRFLDLWKPGIRGRVVLMSVFNALQTVGFYGFSNWVPSLLVSQGITVSKSLGYTTLIAVVAPLGPLVGYALGDRVERKHVIVGAAAAILVCGLIFAGARDAAVILAMGAALTIASNSLSFSLHAYQQELFPTGIRARAVGFAYSWSRASVIFSSFVIEFILSQAGARGVFVFIGGAMALVMLLIGLLGPRTAGRSLESLSHRRRP